MPNITSALKEEISRIARKEMRAELANLKKSSGTYRTEIADLKRRVQAAEGAVKRLARTTKLTSIPDPAAVADGKQVRFSAKGLASQRRRLGLSADDCGLLVGATGQSIYNWESGGARPRAIHLPAIAALKTLGKKSAAAILESRRAQL